MGRVRTNTVKKAARQIVEKYYNKLTIDFQTNKKLVNEAADIPSKKMRNKIAGFVTHLMRRIQKGDNVRGISLKLQEEERERRLDYVPPVSEVTEIIRKGLYVSKQTKAMIVEAGFQKLDNVIEVKNKKFRKNNRRPRRN
mmetsp:Transcript_5675/g.8368  ORF Transcript_5675/g.8368 Transcript_5675/m.8368 type:complete len:140 (+) Transcript_5675:35-454(+)